MRLKPGLSFDEAYEALFMQATLTWGAEEAVRMVQSLREIAGFMAVVGHFDVPDEVEPFFSHESASENS
jgi:hypothetical protein